MDLLEFHHMDDRPVSIDRFSVVLMEPHVSGTGTLMRVGPIERVHEMHLREDYEYVKTEVTMSEFDRALRALNAQKNAGKELPF